MNVYEFLIIKVTSTSFENKQEFGNKKKEPPTSIGSREPRTSDLSWVTLLTLRVGNPWDHWAGSLVTLRVRNPWDHWARSLGGINGNLGCGKPMGSLGGITGREHW